MVGQGAGDSQCQQQEQVLPVTSPVGWLVGWLVEMAVIQITTDQTLCLPPVLRRPSTWTKNPCSVSVWQCIFYEVASIRRRARQGDRDRAEPHCRFAYMTAHHPPLYVSEKWVHLTWLCQIERTRQFQRLQMPCCTGERTELVPRAKG